MTQYVSVISRVIALKCGCANPRRRLWRDGMVSTMRRKSWDSNPQSTIRNTEDDLKILLRILSLTLKHYVPYPPTWPGSLCLDIIRHSPNTLCNRLSSYLEICLFNRKKDIEPTPPKWFFVFVNWRISTTWCWGIWTLVHYHSRSGPKSGFSTGKFSLHLRRRRVMETVWFWALLDKWFNRLSLGIRRGEKRNW
jgi:hypothetical protein